MQVVRGAFYPVNHPSCCIVIPVYSSAISREEEFSVRHCIETTEEVPIRFVTSPNLRYSKCISHWQSLCHSRSCEVVEISPSWLQSVETYNSLMLQAWFYRLFIDWNYILIHQLDARLIDASKLSRLLAFDFSYVGAPFVAKSHWNRLAHGNYIRIFGGNGGLSLRKVEDMVKLLETPAFYKLPIRGLRDCVSFLLMRYGVDHPQQKPNPRALIQIFCRSIKMSHGAANTLSTMANTTTCQEDYLFSIFAPRFFKWFRVPSPQLAASFFIDSYPDVIEKAYGLQEHLLGCHGWEKNNLAFWRTRYPSIFQSRFTRSKTLSNFSDNGF